MLLALKSSIVYDHTNIWKVGDHVLNERTISEFVKMECEENLDKHAMLVGNQIFDHGLEFTITLVYQAINEVQKVPYSQFSVSVPQLDNSIRNEILHNFHPAS